MIPVGGTNGLIDRLLTLLGWRASSNTADPQRKDALNCLNYAERFIAAKDALLYLNYSWPITVSAAATTISLTGGVFTDSRFEYAKDHVLLDGNGFPLEWKTPDTFHSSKSSADRVFSGPTAYVIATDHADGMRKIMLDAPQPSLATFRLIGQRAPLTLADDVNSLSLLPPGDELVLLLPIAEQYAKQRKRELDAPMLDAQTREALENFYSKQRANKLTAATDNNSVSRVNERRAKHAAGD
jgi:hypothetical protein